MNREPDRECLGSQSVIRYISSYTKCLHSISVTYISKSNKINVYKNGRKTIKKIVLQTRNSTIAIIDIEAKSGLHSTHGLVFERINKNLKFLVKFPLFQKYN